MDRDAQVRQLKLRLVPDGQRIDRAYKRIMDATRGRSKARQERNEREVMEVLASPCKYRPGSTDKIAVLMARYELGLWLHFEGDAHSHITKPVDRGTTVRPEPGIMEPLSF